MLKYQMLAGLLAVVAAIRAVAGPEMRQSPERQLGDAPWMAPPSPVTLAGSDPTGNTLAGFTVDTTDREQVRAFYGTVFAASENVPFPWSGTVTNCDAGTTTAELRDAVVRRINYFRAMAGVPAMIALDDAYSAKCQQAALIMAANNSLSHTPPPSWHCYSAAGDEAARHADLALASFGPESITEYIEDFGAGNALLGHRRWILYPQTQKMGTGDLPTDGTNSLAANATWVIDGHYGGPRPPTREEFVAWPPPGFVPVQLVFPRWSFAVGGGDFGAAGVAVTRNGVPIATVLEELHDGYGENTLVWYFDGMDVNQPWILPEGSLSEATYQVAVTNVLVGGSTRDYSYQVSAFDASVASPVSALPVVQGASNPSVNWPNRYRLSPVDGATGYQWRRSTPVAYTVVEGGETGFGALVPAVTPGYNVRQSSLRASGTWGFHLAHVQPEDQFLTLQRHLLVGAAGNLAFRSRLGWSTTNEVARVQVSLDDGSSWRTLWYQVGTGGAGDGGFQTRSVSLASVAGRSVQLRFVYRYSGQGGYYQGADIGTAWYLDDIAVTGCEELSATTVTPVDAGPAFTVLPTTVGVQVLQVRALVWGDYPLEWGPVTRVQPAIRGIPSAQLLKNPTLTGGQLVIDVALTNSWPGLGVYLEHSAGAGLPWTPDSAVAEAVAPPTAYRFRPTLGGPVGYYRVRIE